MTDADRVIATFRKRADTWETDQGELGKIVASELRVVIDTFEKMIQDKPETWGPYTRKGDWFCL